MIKFNLDYATLKEVRLFLYKATGLYWEERGFDYLKIKIEIRMRATKKFSPREYLSLLRSDKEEMQRLIDELTINETYFMREIDSVDVYLDKVLKVDRIKNERIKIVSVGCSSGEEPYSIVILVNEKYPYLKNKLDIKALDIDSQMIKKAKRGVYSFYSLRAMEEQLVKRYFSEENKEYILDSRVKTIVRFYNLSVFDPEVKALIKDSDLILSRNVLIYFGMESKKRAIELFYDSLVDNGYLILGKSESIFNVNDKFVMVHYPNVILYKKEVNNGS